MSTTGTNSNNENATYHHGDLRRTLIAAALELAAEGKEWNFSLREVARRAGVSHNAPYNHFAHKRDLMAAAALAGHEALRKELISAVAKVKDPRTAVFRMASAYIKFGIKNAPLYQLMFTASLSGPDWRPDAVIAAGEETRAILEDILRSGAVSGVFQSSLTRKANMEAASLFAWSAVHGLTMLTISGLTNMEEASLERATDKILTMILDGMGKKNELSER